MAEDDLLTFDELRTVQNEERGRDTLQELDDDFFHRARDYLDLKRDPESHLENREYRNARRVIEDIVDQRQKKIMKLAFLSVKSDLHVDNLLPKEEELFEQVRDIIRDHRGAMQDRIFEVDGTATGDSLPDTESGDAGGREPAAEDAEDTGTGDDLADASADEPGDPAPVHEQETVEDPEEDGPATPAPNDGDGTTIFGDDAGDGGDADAAADTDSAEPETNEEDADDDTDTDADDAEGVHIRIEESVPAFMGTDLEPYGPYDPGDETRVPEKNASILVDKGKAERVE